MPHAERPGGPVAAAKKCATHGRLSVTTRDGGCTAWSSMRRFDWRLSTSVNGGEIMYRCGGAKMYHGHRR